MNESLDVDGFCRHWRDSNGHRFTLERVEPDLERGGGALIVHGTVSGCVCGGHVHHDGPGEFYPDSAKDLAQGNTFGWDPDPCTHADVARYVGLLMSATEDEWSELSLGLDDPDEDFADCLAPDLLGAVWALNGPDVVEAGSAVHVLRDLLVAGHSDVGLLAAVLLAHVPGECAPVIRVGVDGSEREALVGGLLLVPALRGVV